jgi:hypothetical protein
MAVVSNDKAILFGNFLLQAFDFRAVKLNKRVTFCTDQMVMVVMLVLVFVTGTPVVEVDFTGQLGFHQQAQGSIDRRKANGLVALFDQIVEFLNTEMRFGFQKGLQNEVALGCPLEPVLGQVTVKYLKLFLESTGC